MKTILHGAIALSSLLVLAGPLAAQRPEPTPARPGASRPEDAGRLGPARRLLRALGRRAYLAGRLDGRVARRERGACPCRPLAPHPRLRALGRHGLESGPRTFAPGERAPLQGYGAGPRRDGWGERPALPRGEAAPPAAPDGRAPQWSQQPERDGGAPPARRRSRARRPLPLGEGPL